MSDGIDGTAETDDYLFVCPACAESISLDGRMLEALLSHGCVICGSSVTRDAFETA